ncbi:unnamed protein product, partial [Oppiella nova]
MWVRNRVPIACSCSPDHPHHKHYAYHPCRTSMIEVPVIIECDEDFCQSFIGNNNTIDYGYSHEFDDNSYGYYVFINQNHWRLLTDNTSVRLESTTSHTSNWFGNDYKMAFNVWFDRNAPNIGQQCSAMKLPVLCTGPLCLSNSKLLIDCNPMNLWIHWLKTLPVNVLALSVIFIMMCLAVRHVNQQRIQEEELRLHGKYPLAFSQWTPKGYIEPKVMQLI